MPRLEVEIGGSASGLEQAANRSFGILESLQRAADGLKIDLFKAEDVNTLNSIGGALTIVTGKIKEYTTAAVQGSVAFQEQRTGAVFTELNTKLSVLTGNAILFGTSIKSQKAEVSAYESAINKLLANGLNPFDSKITGLKSNLDTLNAKILAQKEALATLNAEANRVDPFAKFGRSLGIIDSLRFKLSNLKTALGQATDVAAIDRYNARIRAAQTELERLTKSSDSAAQSARKLSNGYNAVGLEFGRIIQDAPYAANNFGSIGNNITRLVEVIPGYVAQQKAIIVANGGLATSTAVAKASLLSMVTGFGGVTIAISAVVAAYTFYQQSQLASQREQDKLNGKTVEYIDTLKGVEKAQLQGAKAAQDEMATLRTLFKVYQDSNQPLEVRKNAYKQIQQEYPAYFKNIDFEKSAAASTIEIYGKLTQTLLATAQARAGVNLMTENAERQLENNNKLTKLDIEYGKQQLKIDQLKARQKVLQRTEGSAAELAGARSQIEDRISKAVDAQAKIAKTIRDNKSDTLALNKQNLSLEEKVAANMKKGGTLVDLNNEKDKKAPKTPKDRLTPLVDRSTGAADLAGLIGNDVDVEKIRQKYVNIYDELNKAAAKKGADLIKINSLRDQAIVNEGKEISQVIIAENLRVAQEVQRIQNESGIKSAETREKELLQVKKWYDDEVIKAQGNAVLLAQVEEGKVARLEFINDKYNQKRLEAETKILDKIDKETSKGFVLNDNHTAKATKKIDGELNKRLKLISKYFDDLRALYAKDPVALEAITVTQSGVVAKLEGDAGTAKDGGLGKELARGVSKFGSDFFRVLTTVNQQVDATFANIVGKLATTLTDSLTDVFVNILQKKLTETLTKAFDSMSKSQQALAGGALILGSVISGITAKTSYVGQGVGGALKGAGAGAIGGAAIAGPAGVVPGAIIGGIVGAIGGIFGASKARKQEELQKKQLAEAEKQTKELQRQNALAYTSSIIGRATENGIVSGIEVNEMGQLSVKIVGQDLLVMLDKAKKSRDRGV